ncbi:cytidylyltransferase domain-containing protein [Thalassospira povalilytica]|uniref:acylneuraminate cytidylyltransferase family protein n=1 Tax=Thalassospira povalilytica TaxID=732237 RepID=UPI003AA7D0BC
MTVRADAKALKVMAVVTARGGSKGLPNKNVLDFCGKPLIAWSIEAAKKSKLVDRVVVSTEDENIAEIAREYGADVPFMRPDELATDEAVTLDVLKHLVSKIQDYDLIVLLQPTSPLRTVQDIDTAIELCASNAMTSTVSVCEADKSPYWMYYLSEEGQMKNVLTQDQTSSTRRQDLPQAFALNGAVYVISKNALLAGEALVSKDTLAFPMPKSRSVDIDSEEDFVVAEAFFALSKNQAQ